MKSLQAFTIIILTSFSSFSQNFYTIKGKIIDESNQNPIEGAYVYFADKSQGISSNAKGEFLLKFPKTNLDTTLVINAFGYEPRFDFIESISDSIFIFKMNPIVHSKLKKDIFLKMNENPKFGVKTAFSELNKLYPSNPNLLIGFYKEDAFLNEEFAQVREAILKVERVTGTSFQEFGDKVKMMKGRSLENGMNANVIRKYGFKNGFDIVTKSIESGIPTFFGEELENYNFNLDSNLININNRYNYVYEFTPISKKVKAGRNGKIFIDTLTNAIVRIEYAFTQNGAGDIFKDNSFSNIKKIGKEVVSITNYRLFKGKWFLQDSKLSIITELVNMLSDNQKVSNKSDFTFVTTDIVKTNGKNINYDEIMEDSEDCKKVKNFDDKFWQNYNFVIPNINSIASKVQNSGLETARR